ncbi:MAG: DUF488 domain-containing protein [Nitrospirota bacterium]
MIYSIGYQKRKLSEIVSVMEEKDIDLLVDVRSVPYSRKPEFNRNRLQEALGSRYEWMGEVLGGKKGPAKEIGIKKLLFLHGQGRRLLLMCMEHHPCDCHRLYDISRRLAKRGVEVVHLFDGHEQTTDELSEEACNERKKDRNR